ncbi:unnamed protein product [Heligmosomoides polygyrus]|uniref:Uncharacterized protein n=1 Tax=Heligmosomoides polygyrus TaxID=6339 RepID=A0A183GUY4_HELPZ|nr:unnamed protein product [Heligmosomoides polygyrus]
MWVILTHIKLDRLWATPYLILSASNDHLPDFDGVASKPTRFPAPVFPPHPILALYDINVELVHEFSAELRLNGSMTFGEYASGPLHSQDPPE